MSTWFILIPCMTIAIMFSVWRITLPAVLSRQAEREQQQAKLRMEAEQLTHRQYMETRKLEMPATDQELATRKAEADSSAARYRAEEAETRRREREFNRYR
jgi:hypothetical protein